MNAASSFAFLKRKAPQKKPQPQAQRQDDLFHILPHYDEQPNDEPDTNVISVVFNSLKQAEENVQTGDPVFCKHCRSCLSTSSKLYKKAEYEEKFVEPKVPQANEEEKKQELPKDDIKKSITTSIADQDKVWICEFCGVHNVVNLDAEEVPTNNDVIFLLQSAQQISKGPTNAGSETTTVFCIDNSGSMSVTQEVKGKHDLKHGLSPEEYEMLKQFIEQGASQYLPGQATDSTYITRKQCVLAAIEDQLLEMKKEYPNRKVGLVTFNNEVCVLGDGKDVPETIAGDKLNKYDVLRQIGEECGQKLITTSVKDSAEGLIKKFEKLKESGKTALGPALLVSLGLALKGKQGSRVILCTDGLANVGLGEMDTSEGLAKAEEFYTSVANIAKENGVSISVMSIKGEGCKLEILGQVADLTTGSLTRVDPNDLTSKFATIMKQEVIGTQVEVRLRLHQGMKFRNESAEFLKERESLYEKTVGNVTAQTQLTFEYEMRPDEELAEFEIDVAKLETVPFQAQIVYTSTNGDRMMRVITNTLKTTQNQEEAEKSVKVDVLATRALQQQAHFAAKGQYSESNQLGQNWGNYFGSKIAPMKSNHQDFDVMAMYQDQNDKIQRAATNRLAKTQYGGPIPQSGQPASFNTVQPGPKPSSNNQTFGMNQGGFGLFSGGQVQQQAQSGGLFSSKPQPSSSPQMSANFGQQKSAGLFSSLSGSKNIQPSPPSGGLFGGSRGSANAQQNSFSGGFGGNAQPQSNSLFGNNQSYGSNNFDSFSFDGFGGSQPQAQNIARKSENESAALEDADEDYEVFHEAKNYKFSK